MSKIDLDFPALCLAIAIGVVGVAWAPNPGMNYYERQAYEDYVDLCREQGVTPEPPHVHDFSQEDFDRTQ